jgi:hypothetical protein
MVRESQVAVVLDAGPVSPAARHLAGLQRPKQRQSGWRSLGAQPR